MKFRITVIACGTALLIAAAVGAVVASRNHRQPAPPPDVPVAASPAEVRVKAVERSQEPPVEGLAEMLIAMIEGDNSDCEDRSLGCSKAASALQQGRGRPCHIGGDATTPNSATPPLISMSFNRMGRRVTKNDSASFITARDIVVPELEKCLKKEGECAK